MLLPLEENDDNAFDEVAGGGSFPDGRDDSIESLLRQVEIQLMSRR